MGKILFALTAVLLLSPQLSKDLPEDDFKVRINRSLSNIYMETMSNPGRVSVDTIIVDKNKKTINLYTNLFLSYLPMREDLVSNIYDSVRWHLPKGEKKHKIQIYSDGVEISSLIPNFYRTKSIDRSRIISHKVNKPLVRNISYPSFSFDKGLENNHIAMWQSHGWYYNQHPGRWEWQRARIFQTVEDLYTQSYVVPFLVPMLENAGANVLLPRERDYNRVELIIDNDNQYNSEEGFYREIEGKESWRDSDGEGFANPKKIYFDGENPFKMGRAREVNTVTHGDESFAEWRATMPETGRYGVYISYQTTKKSSDDAIYSVYHTGGRTDLSVNQQMGGGTWIFLGYFDFEKGKPYKITLSNRSHKAGKIITADGVKIGGGMGNIARMPITQPDSIASKEILFKGKKTELIKPSRFKIEYEPEVSGYPRYTEGARYWMQWAGVPDSIYSLTESKSDYIDDYAGRGAWVNWLSGGSSVLPKEGGLNIPIDLAFAFHTDAGTLLGDTIVGTLGIYMTHYNDEQFENGKSRWASRDLSEIIMDEIIGDIRRQFEPEWKRRYLWNRSYSEARTPNVPTMLLELLSHQNFADMRYGLDPTFRFVVSRSIYKGMLKFIATQYGRDYRVQPLPIKDFYAVFNSEKEARLYWQPTLDPAEPTAVPTQYILYTAINGAGFDNGLPISGNSHIAVIEEDSIYSYRVVAINEGGKSFPSETLSLCRKSEEKGEILIVNGFTRVSAPFSFSRPENDIAGFVGSIDNGVPYIADYHFTGQMHEFRRSVRWMSDDAAGFGDSNSDYETVGIAGNSFNYPYVHGIAFRDAGYSFVSSAATAVENGMVDLADYDIVDWILGKQREWSVARGAKPSRFKTFSKAEQQAIGDYCNSGGNIIVSGAFVGSDFWDNPAACDQDREWAKKYLKYQWRNNWGAVKGKIKAVASPFPSIKGNYNYYNSLNSESYIVENPDAIEPADKDAFTIFRYSENNLSAAILYKGETYNSSVLGFPIEAVKEESQRGKLIKAILDAFNQ